MHKISSLIVATALLLAAGIGSDRPDDFRRGGEGHAY